MTFQAYLLSMPEDLVALAVCSLALNYGISPGTIQGWANGTVRHPADEPTLTIAEACTFRQVTRHTPAPGCVRASGLIS